jgi:hypothetical protein
LAGVAANPSSGGPQFSSLHFINHLHDYDSKNTTCAGVACLKFDIHLRDYHWVSQDPSAYLVFEFTLEQPERYATFATGSYSEVPLP